MIKILRSLTACILIAAVYTASAEQIKRVPVVILETELGAIEIEVYSNRAPLSSASFLSYVDNGSFTEKGAFYRAVRTDNDNNKSIGIEIIQGGILKLDSLLSSPGIPHESTNLTGLLHVSGAVSLARKEPGTGNGAVFFICIGDQPEMDFGGKRNPDGQGYAVFGQVRKGMDVVMAIQQQKTSEWPGYPGYPQLIEKPITIIKAYRQ